MCAVHATWAGHLDSKFAEKSGQEETQDKFWVTEMVARVMMALREHTGGSCWAKDWLTATSASIFASATSNVRSRINQGENECQRGRASSIFTVEDERTTGHNA